MRVYKVPSSMTGKRYQQQGKTQEDVFRPNVIIEDNTWADNLVGVRANHYAHIEIVTYFPQ